MCSDGERRCSGCHEGSQECFSDSWDLLIVCECLFVTGKN